MPELERTNSQHPAFLALIAELDAFLAELNGQAHEFYAGHNRVSEDIPVVLASVDGTSAGCGAFRDHGDGAVEIKRMYVSPSLRRHGVGVSVLAELESWARELGFKRAMLETSKRLVPAVSLYGASGYEVIPNYPPYEEITDSVCMAKRL